MGAGRHTFSLSSSFNTDLPEIPDFFFFFFFSFVLEQRNKPEEEIRALAEHAVVCQVVYC